MVVLRRSNNHIRPSGQSVVVWHCKCDCGIEKDVEGAELRNGNTKSCGCLQRELTSSRESGSNTYDLTGDYGIGFIMHGEEFYFDLEDYDVIKNEYWRVRDGGYVVSKDNIFHRLIMNCPSNKVVDHINNKKVNDNRKQNLRICTQADNLRCAGIMSTNRSGIIGVSWSKTENKWLTRLNKNKKCQYLKYFNDKNEAIRARLLAEKKYFGEFAPQKHLYEKYNIK